jgi:beta-N-acetylhexosaminidase
MVDSRRQRSPQRLLVIKLRRRRLGLAAALLAAAAGAVGVAFGAGHTTGPSGAHSHQHSASVQASVQTAAPYAALVSRLSYAQLAGQRIIYSYEGLTPPQALLSLIRAGEAAGVIFFSGNIASASQLRAVITELQRANASGPVHVPLLMMTDQEGGLVRRLAGPPGLSEKQIGSSPHASALAGEAGASAAGNLTSVGINVNLAPVLDVYRQRGDFIDEDQRSYSSSTAVVASLGAAFITAQQRGGVAATAKHFPGLGAATAAQDTDLAPATIDLPLAKLRAVDEFPYRAAITAGTLLVMVSWATYPALDPRHPAGLSSAIIHGELRGRLGFRGVTITDALGAGALNAYGSFGQRALAAAHAGADLLLCATGSLNTETLPDGVNALQALTAGLAGHRLDRHYAQAAAARVLTLRARG